MIKHIVMWKLKEENKFENAKKIKNQLEGLKESISEIRFIEVGININKKENYDVVLNSEFDTMDDLSKYQVHPEHVKAGCFIKSVVESRTAVDYEF